MYFVVLLKNLTVGAVSELLSVLLSFLTSCVSPMILATFLAKAEDREDVDKFCPSLQSFVSWATAVGGTGSRGVLCE